MRPRPKSIWHVKSGKRPRSRYRPWVALLDILAAGRLDERIASQAQRIYAEWAVRPDALLADRCTDDAREVLKGLSPCHFPAVFPEVFSAATDLASMLSSETRLGRSLGRKRTSFGCGSTRAFSDFHRKTSNSRSSGCGANVLTCWPSSNPNRLSQRECESCFSVRATIQEWERAIRTCTRHSSGDSGDYSPNRGKWASSLPRATMSEIGTTEFRRVLLTEGTLRDVTFLSNKGGWVFDDVHAQKIFVLLSAMKASSGRPVTIRGPYTSLQAYREGSSRPAVQFSPESIMSWTDTNALPLLPSDASVDIFARIRTAPRLDDPTQGGWRVHAHRELDSSLDKKDRGGVIEFGEKRSEGMWPVLTGASFNYWDPTNGHVYGWADKDRTLAQLLESRRNSARRQDSAFAHLSARQLDDIRTLSAFSPRVVFRKLARDNDSRTLISALVPARVFLIEACPYFVFQSGTERDQAFLVGILSSRIADWYARRFVERNVSFHIVSALPIPRPPTSDEHAIRVVELAGRLGAPDDRFKDWAKAVGVQWGPLDPATKEAMIYELDAVVAHLYGLSREQLIHIFETFHEGWDYHSRMNSTLQMFDAWTRKP